MKNLKTSIHVVVQHGQQLGTNVSFTSNPNTPLEELVVNAGAWKDATITTGTLTFEGPIDLIEAIVHPGEFRSVANDYSGELITLDSGGQEAIMQNLESYWHREGSSYDRDRDDMWLEFNSFGFDSEAL
jgi:hypothetical protein